MIRHRILSSPPLPGTHGRTLLTTARSVHTRTQIGATPLRPTAIRGQFGYPSTSAYRSRVLTTAAEPAKKPKLRSRIYRGCVRTFAWCGFAGITLGATVLGIFLYDASTYKEGCDETDLGIAELALHPRRGGPKNLPIAELLVDDEDTADAVERIDKPHLVILGSGWGSVALLKGLDPNAYHITVISPSNYFLYTPLLPSATVGTLEVRSLIEPIRRITRAIGGHFLKAAAETIEFSEKLVEVSQVIDGERRHFYVPYDKLVIAVGSKTRTHGVDGLEHVHFLKDVNDARLIRAKVIENFEQACLPTTSDEERRRLLSFVVCGGGPTGVEFAAELFDMLNEDLTLRYPRILRNEVSVHVVQSRSHILNTYDEALSKYAEERFARSQIDVLTNSRVARIEKDKVIFTQKDPGSKKVITKELPYGLCLWSTGVAQTNFAQEIAKKIDIQKNSHALETDTHLRLLGTPLGDVYCIGDCSTVQNNIASHITEYLRYFAYERGVPKDEKNIHITFKQWQQLVPRIKKRFPQAADHLRRLDQLFEKYDEDRSGTLDFQELKKLLEQIDSKLTSLPATAQRAHQQGLYLAKKFNKLAAAAPALALNEVVDGDIDAAVFKAFDYKHLGSLAYVGNAAVFDIGNGFHFGGGLLFLYAWRSAYFAQSVSARTRMMLAMDWTKRAFFGRDLMNF